MPEGLDQSFLASMARRGKVNAKAFQTLADLNQQMGNTATPQAPPQAPADGNLEVDFAGGQGGGQVVPTTPTAEEPPDIMGTLGIIPKPRHEGVDDQENFYFLTGRFPTQVELDVMKARSRIVRREGREPSRVELVAAVQKGLLVPQEGIDFYATDRFAE